jgi:hypothetical protein
MHFNPTHLCCNPDPTHNLHIHTNNQRQDHFQPHLICFTWFALFAPHSHCLRLCMAASS